MFNEGRETNETTNFSNKLRNSNYQLFSFSTIFKFLIVRIFMEVCVDVYAKLKRLYYILSIYFRIND